MSGSAPRRAVIADAASRLEAVGIEAGRLEARLLLAHALDLAPERLLLDLDAPVPAEAAERFAALLSRRAGREPLALILGRREFWSLDFAVSPATLIPRPESETLIEAALAAFAGRAPPARILDLGTGTGCLLLAALAEFPAAFGVGIDRSPAAAALARRNAAMLGLAGRAAFACGDWAEALAPPPGRRFDLVLCNPPYIEAEEIPRLMPEVARHEPKTALDGGPDGLDAYRRLIPDLPRLLADGGLAVLELGQGQAAAVARLATDAGLAGAARADLAGTPRALVLRPATG